jgi:hypothetical protein
MFYYEPPEGESNLIGRWSTANLDPSKGAVVQPVFRSTDDPETAELWRAELAAGRLPQNTEDVP